MAATVYVGLGSNQGDKIQYIREATGYLGKLRETKVTRCASLYKSEPKDILTDEWFINSVIALETELSPRALLKELLLIEQKIGRDMQEKGQKTDRIIDLDILLYNDTVLEDRDVDIPHPKLHKRRFVLEPLSEIAPDLIHPVCKKSIKELYEKLGDRSKVIRLPD